MKTHRIDLHKIQAMSNAQGVVRVQVDATVAPGADREATTSLLTMSEDTARVMLLLIKAQLAEFDSRKAKSRRG